MKDRQFLLVAIGPATGGTDSLQQILDRLPTGHGLSYVVVCAAPAAEQISRTLAAAATLPVLHLESTMPLQPDRVYVTHASQVEILDGAVAPSAEPGVPSETAADRRWRVLVGHGVAAGEARARQLLSRLITVQEDERRRIARDLHDQIGQQMTALRLHLNALIRSQGQPDWPEKAAAIDALTDQIDRDLAFLAWELRPAVLDDLGLAPALERYVQQWSAACGVRAEFLASRFDDRQLGTELKTVLYRIAQEALNNVHKHAHATHASVVLRQGAGQVVMMVEDDGVGFRPAGDVPRPMSMGLLSMSERASLVGGTCIIESGPGEGTTVLVQIPLPAPDAAPHGAVPA